jgi:hypothetical protein
MSTIDRIGMRRREAKQPVEKTAVVWICSECFDAYDATTADGNCPNPGHAPVKLHPTHVKSTEPEHAAPEHERFRLRPVARLRERSKAA